MPKMLADANRKLVWAPTLTDPSNPAVSDLADDSVLDISCLVTAANFSLGATGENAVDDSALCAEGNDQSPGRVTYEAGMNFFRWTTEEEDKAWGTFTTKGIGGYLVQRMGQSYREPFAAGDEVQVYQAITGTPMIQTPEAGSSEKFRQMFYVQSQGTNERATVTGA